MIRFTVVLTLMLNMSLLAPSVVCAADREQGFKTIFNGKDLSGWSGLDGMWEVKAGAISCTGKSKAKNWLIWQGGQPGDFELRLKFKWTKGNSGVQVRSHVTDKKQFWVRGYQVEVAQQKVMGLWHHSLSPEKYRSKLALAGEATHYASDGSKKIEQIGDSEKIKAVYKENQWNDLTVIARGPKLIQIINGKTFSQLTDEDKTHSYKAGLIALQDHGKGCQVQFKAIRIKMFD
jgi:hypothetical protein